jgi:hypothetical protein
LTIFLKKEEEAMKENIQLQPRVGDKSYATHPVKLTALVYLKEALLNERYEECFELIQTAKEFGAQRTEIENLLEDPRREVT